MSKGWSISRERVVEKDDVEVVPDFEIINFEGDVSVIDEGDSKVTVTIGETGQFKGKVIDFTFGSTGNVSNKWLNVASSVPSNEVPLIMPQDGNLLGITFANEDDDVDQDVEIYVNGVLKFTWELRNKRWAWKTDINLGTPLLQGERVSVFMRRYNGGTGDPTSQNPIVEVFFNLTSNYANEGGGQTGV